MKISEATFAVIDVETTGLNPETDHIVEIAAVVTNAAAPVRFNLGMWSTFVRPPVNIPPESSAVHGITREQVAHAPCQADAENGLSDFLDRFEGEFSPVTLVMHNADFDAGFLGFNRPGCLCTMRLARHLWPGAPSHKNGVLRYWLWPGAFSVDTLGIAPHRALADAMVTAQILRGALFDNLTLTELGIETVAQLIEYAESPIIFERWPLGKYRDKPIAAAPPDYISWCLREMKDLSRDMRFTLESYLKGVA